jgi:nucleotide-binding universal stress UspA family protein
MGKQGEEGLQALLLGSVGSKVAQLSSIPVTLVN